MPIVKQTRNNFRYNPQYFAILCAVIIAYMLSHPHTMHGQDSTVVSYDFGEFSITQNQFSSDSRFFDMPVAFRGIVAVPDGEGPFPLIVFMHGAYNFCATLLVNEADVYPCPEADDLRQFEGFSYLAEGLADRGYAVLIPDLSAEYTFGYGEPRFGERAMQILNMHLMALSSGTNFAEDIHTRLDMTQLISVGHSRGAGLSLMYAVDERAGFNLSALALLTPAYMLPDVMIPETMPTALVIATCDGDVGTEQPLLYLEQLPPLRPALTVQYTLVNGTHNGFSTQLEGDFGQRCEESSLLPRDNQQAFTVEFLAEFADLALAEYPILTND